MEINIITHRGLDPAQKPYFVESSLEAFTDQLKRGYGLEFDLRFTSDNQIVIIHDANLKRISGGSDERNISDVSSDEILRMEFHGCHLITFAHLLELIETIGHKGIVCAIHLKHVVQEPIFLDSIVEYLKDIDPNTFILFDISIATAKYLKSKNPALQLAPSVAHPYDIKRYNGVVGGTLLSIEEVIQNKNLFDWVWLDEWDTADEDEKVKTFYNEETFSVLRSEGLKIALVTPELHSSSPGLLGGEAHSDASTHEILMERIKAIIVLEPEAVCTDFPDEVKGMFKS